jgi:Skp family chaperone for outer membrane proteins
MKNWARIVIFLAAMAFSATAQQPVTPQSAIINPGEPISVASDNQVLQSLPGTLKNHQPRRQPDLKKLTEELNEHQRGLIERRNQELKRRFDALQQAGGWQRAFLSQLALQRLALPNATEQLNAAQRFITNFVFCDRPLIAEQTSEFQTFLPTPDRFPLGKISKEFIVEPLASIIINGCSFGPDTGEVRLLLSQGNFLTLQVSNWSDSSIFATLGANPGIPDQEAQLVVVRKDGTQSIPMTVEFFQHRVAQVFNVAANLSAVSVFTSAHTTQDQFRFVTFAASGDSDIAASHYTFCCSAVSGTDGWLFKLKNNWEIPDSQVFRVIGFDTALATSAASFERFDVEDGITDCGIFGSDEGSVTGVSVTNHPVFFPDFQSELDIAWQAGSNCSGLVYFVQVVIWGPDSVPFE